MEIIVPAAGLSTRYHSPKPKYLLFDADGQLMLVGAVRQFIGHQPITIGILREHDEVYAVQELIAAQIPEAKVVVLDQRTAGPADTVYHIIQQAGIRGEFFVKDCDSFFNYDYRPGNVVCTTRVGDYDTISNLAGKSFVVSNDQNIVIDIVEKQIVSDIFCVGGYQIRDAVLYCRVFQQLREISSEIFVSHIIQAMVAQGEIFVHNAISDWTDVGTITEWHAYNAKLTDK